VQSFHWDRAKLVGTIEDGAVWEDDHPALYSWGQTINEDELGDDGCWRLKCYDYCRDEVRDALFDDGVLFNSALPSPGESEWIVNVGIPMMPISHSDLMPIRSERSDAGLSQCETVIGIRQEFCLLSWS
jgi:hypothetical protein